MTAAEQVLAIEEIKRVFAMRLRVMDTKQWDLYGPLHTEDVVTETLSGLPGDKQPKVRRPGQPGIRTRAPDQLDPGHARILDRT